MILFFDGEAIVSHAASITPINSADDATGIRLSDVPLGAPAQDAGGTATATQDAGGTGTATVTQNAGSTGTADSSSSNSLGPGYGSAASATSGDILISDTGNEDYATVDPEDTGINYTTETIDGQTIYVFEGKRYTLGTFYGVHRISGYSSEENGSDKTASGETAKSRHTLSADSELPFGTIILLNGVSGPESSVYNGMYVVEDRGGERIENEGLLDIYCDTLVDALAVSHKGWNYMEAFIAVPY